jgi:ubiquinone/menaquinone biosynthesis C-methylase UbiE
MLRQGQAYLAREGQAGVHLARAGVDRLPFADGIFDGVICSGSLHLFPDTVFSLREIARTMKPGAPLSVQTFVAGDTPVNRVLKPFRKVHAFELAALQQSVAAAGFEKFQSELDGIFLLFSAWNK